MEPIVSGGNCVGAAGEGERAAGVERVVSGVDGVAAAVQKKIPRGFDALGTDILRQGRGVSAAALQRERAAVRLDIDLAAESVSVRGDCKRAIQNIKKARGGVIRVFRMDSVLSGGDGERARP